MAVVGKMMVAIESDGDHRRRDRLRAFRLSAKRELAMKNMGTEFFNTIDRKRTFEQTHGRCL